MRPDASKLDQFRGYIASMKHSQFSIPAEMSEVRVVSALGLPDETGRACSYARFAAQVIQSDFVERRQASQGGEAMTQDDLLFRMTAARCVFIRSLFALGAPRRSSSLIGSSLSLCVCVCPTLQASRLVVRRD